MPSPHFWCICGCYCVSHGMVIYLGTVFKGLNYSVVSQTPMSTSMEREHRVQ